MAVVKRRRAEIAALRVACGHLSRPEIPTVRRDLVVGIHVPSESLRASPSHIILTVCARTTDNKQFTSDGGLVNDDKSERQTVTRQHVRGNQSLDRAPCRQEEHEMGSGVTRSC